MDKNTRFKIGVAATAAVSAAAIGFSAFNSRLTVRRYRIASRKIRREKGVRIVHLSDLHSHIYGKDQAPLFKKIKKLKPDLIALTGDIADDNNPIEGTRFLLDGISKIAPCYYVTGNHEYKTGRVEEIKAIFRSYGVTVLDGQSRTVSINGNPLVLCGIDDPTLFDGVPGGFSAGMGAFHALSEGNFNILLSHRPERAADYAKYPFDLVLSGHAHGGQVRIPFLINGLFAPDQGLFPKYAGGLYRHPGFTHIISRGLSYNPRVPRVFNPPEIVVIDLQRVMRP